MIHFVLLSGGSGTRLWPLSNEARSKQFLKVLRDSNGRPQSMVQRTFEMLCDLAIEKTITIATCESQVESIKDQVGKECNIVVEPERRDTAPAIMLACAHLRCVQEADLDDSVIVLPIDAYAEKSYYTKICSIDSAIKANVGDIVLMGVEPGYPAEKYGYIVPLEMHGEIRKVSHFVEKPKSKVAQNLIDNGALWNCGVFGFKLSYLMNIIASYIGEPSFERLKDAYDHLPTISFDYEIVEAASSVAVVTFYGAWKDLGTWNTLSEEMSDNCSGRSVIDESTCKNVHVINELNLPLVVIGLSDAIVAATSDGILVSDKAKSAYMKPIVETAAERRPMCETRQWGEYKVLDHAFHEDGFESLEKLLVVKPGKQLSYQTHDKRSEFWTVIDGSGQVVLNGEVRDIKRGTMIHIEPRVKHAVRADQTLSIIEIQCGQLLEEEDIARFGFWWNQ